MGYGIEIDPTYAAVSLERLSLLGLAPVLFDTIEPAFNLGALPDLDPEDLEETTDNERSPHEQTRETA